MDEELEKLKKKIESDLQVDSSIQHLDSILMKIDQIERIRIFYESEKAYCYHLQGLIDGRNDRFQDVIRHYDEALRIYEKLSSRRESNLATLYTNVGSTNLKLTKFSQTLT